MTGNKIYLRNLNMLLAERGMNKRDLCRVLGITQGTVSQWYSGATFPKRSTQEKIADYFGVSVASMFQAKKEVVPVYGDVKAGYPAFTNEEILGYEEVPSVLSSKGELFALRVKGDSMLPLMADGDVVIVLRQSDADDGDYVVALVGEESTLKEIQHNSKGVFFIPQNPAYTPMWFSNEQIASTPVVILGKVVELRKRF